MRHGIWQNHKVYYLLRLHHTNLNLITVRVVIAQIEISCSTVISKLSVSQKDTVDTAYKLLWVFVYQFEVLTQSACIRYCSLWVTRTTVRLSSCRNLRIPSCIKWSLRWMSSAENGSSCETWGVNLWQVYNTDNTKSSSKDRNRRKDETTSLNIPANSLWHHINAMTGNTVSWTQFLNGHQTKEFWFKIKLDTQVWTVWHIWNSFWGNFLFLAEIPKSILNIVVVWLVFTFLGNVAKKNKNKIL